MASEASSLQYLNRVEGQMLVALPERIVSTGPLSENAAGRSRFLSSLESLRGFAALTVCLFHAADIQYAGEQILQQHAALRLVLNGHGAVILFFVLSGFVLRLSLDTRAGTSNALLSLKFVTARLFRLYPVVIATTVVFVCAEQGLLLITTVGASIIVYVLSRHDFEKSLDWAPFRFLGRLSYSFYALHQLGIDIAQR